MSKSQMHKILISIPLCVDSLFCCLWHYGISGSVIV